MVLTITYRTSHKLIYFATLIPLLIYYYAINVKPDLINFVNYTLPVFIMFSGKPIAHINWKWVIRWTLYLSFFFGFYEVLFLENHFYMFNRGLDAYRVVSIFINPNNFGVILALFSFVYIRHYAKGTEGLLVYTLSLVLVKLSGSKTGMIIFSVFSVYLLYFYFKHKIKAFFRFMLKGGVLILVLAIPASIYVGFYFYETVSEKLSFRDFEWETLFVRFNTYYEYFASSGANLAFPWFSEMTYIDNIYLHLMGSFGVLFLILWLILNYYIFLIVRNRIDLAVILFSFLLIGLTTNFLYVWPLSYMYWGFVGYVFYAVKSGVPVAVKT